MKMKNKKTFLFILGLFLIHITMHLHVFNKDLIGPHLWRQSQTQINVQNFYRHDFNILNPRNNSFNGNGNNLQRMEFPIMQWTIAGFYKIFGENIFITRSLMFLFGLSGCIGIYFLFSDLFKNKLAAMMGAYAYSFSPVVFYYMMNPLPDVFALSCGIWFLAFFYRYYHYKKNSDLIFSSIFISFSILAKLPYIMLGIIPFIWFLQLLSKKNGDYKIHVSRLVNYFFFALIPPIAWYAWVIKGWGTTTIVGGILNNPITMEKFKHILGYHLFTMWPRDLIGYIALIPFIYGVVVLFKNKNYRSEIFWQFFGYLLVILAYFGYEFTLIDTVHDYYMMPYLILFFTVVAYGFKKLLENTLNLKPILIFILLAIPLYTFYLTKDHWTIEKSYFNETVLLKRDTLRNLVPKNEKVIILNDVSNFVFSYLIDKQGYIFANDELPTAWIEDMIKNWNAHYMYSTSRVVDTRPDVQPYLDTVIFEEGDLKVFKLKLPPPAVN